MSALRGGEEEREQSLDKKPGEEADDLDPGVTQPQGTGATQAHHPNGVEAATKATPQEEVDIQTETMDFRKDGSPDQPVSTDRGSVHQPPSEQQVSDMSASDLTLHASPKECTREGTLASSGGEVESDQPDNNRGHGGSRGQPSPPGVPDQGSDGKEETREEEWLDVIGSGQLKKKV